MSTKKNSIGIPCDITSAAVVVAAFKKASGRTARLAKEKADGK